MKIKSRQNKIIASVKKQHFITVSELSHLFNVSEMTIRRDLEMLEAQGNIRRTYGGAAALPDSRFEDDNPDLTLEQGEDILSLDKMDVVIASSVNPYFDNLLVNTASKKSIPIIAESIEIPNQSTIVSVDNYQAGFDIGIWTRKYIENLGIEKVSLLDLTFHQPNTLDRSRGFADGMVSPLFSCETVLSINAESRYATAYQIAQDALAVYPQINLIFAINDITALGAIDACRDMDLDPSQMTVITFGLEGKTLKNELMRTDSFCKAGLAMFPEITSLICIKEAFAAFNQQTLQKRNITPHLVLSAENLENFYSRTEDGWELNWDAANANLHIPARSDQDDSHTSINFPKQIGLVVPFSEHEWYKNLTSLLKEQATQHGVALLAIDADQIVHDEVYRRRRQIAQKAAAAVNPGDVLIIDSGPISRYLAEELKTKKDLTIITNSIEAFEILNRTSGIVLILTGGAVRFSTQAMVGPTAELALKELRADKLFLMVSGITLDFGLSHHTISEVTIKQAMINSAREIILVADHTAFMADVGIQVGSLDMVDKLITDDALPPSTRLNLSKAGIQISIA